MSIYNLLGALLDGGTLGIPMTEANDGALWAVMNTVYMIAGVAGVIVIVISGYMFTVSEGDPGKTKQAKNSILYAVIGLVIVAMAFAITQFVIRRI